MPVENKRFNDKHVRGREPVERAFSLVRKVQKKDKLPPGYDKQMDGRYK